MVGPDELIRRLPRGLGGYADLVLAYAVGGPEAAATTAALLGYVPTRREPLLPEPASIPPSDRAPVETVAIEAGTAPADMPFWRLMTQRDLPMVASAPEPEPDVTQPDWPDDPPTPPDLAPWPAILPRARTGFTEWTDGKAPDVAAMVHRLEAGQVLGRVPRRQRRRWGHGLQIILDRTSRLVPFYQDQDRTALHLARLFPRGAVHYAVALDGFDTPLLSDPAGGLSEYRPPAPGTLVVVLGDLGCLATDARRAVLPWAQLGQSLIAAECRPAALTPCPQARWRTAELSAWTMLDWDHRAIQPPAVRERCEHLLCLLSPAIRIEPGLLREIRLLLGADADAGTEADAWQHADMIGRSSVAGTLEREAARRLRGEFSRQPEALRRNVVDRLRRYRAGLAEEIWVEELLCLGEDSLPEDIRTGDLPWARRFLTDLVPEVAQESGGLAWNRRMHERLSEGYFDQPDPAIREAQESLRHLAYPDPADRPSGGSGFDPIDVPGFAAERTISLRQVDKTLMAGESDDAAGSLLATIRTANGWLRVAAADPFWKTGIPPDWAEAWGWDEFGAWVTFSVGGVVQKMRWCPPGRFVMGSPEDEPGRWDDEGPQHEVTFSQGFWLFDTPCTQALWQAVMGGNPSRFPGAEHPVEQVSWTDVQIFLSKLNARLPGLELGLPSEAQWEYACRAGTTTALYTGDIPIVDGKADALDPIAWYRENSGNQTHPVKGKAANPWGLYDMLGNVWEWCADVWQNSYDGAPADGTASAEQSLERVVRGGSWILNAQYVRAAYRSRIQPVVRYDALGFRCARGPVSPASPASQAVAEPADPARGRQAERRSEQGPPRAAVMLRLEPGGQDRCPWPAAPAVRIDSDRERLSFSRFTKPDWADAIGRDRFGLWAGFSVGEVSQKMRWIPPGRFTMGSPPDEPGRYDDEGPQHEVTIGQGFWLFDTPCTQALWSAVMTINPSRFKTADRPVESVDWMMVAEFIQCVNDLISGLDLDLPSEAQWEYACRAGSLTALYSGSIDLLGTSNAPALDPIAWYGGNSGVGFELAEGHPTERWSEKQYSHDRAGTRPVGMKQPNSWGLYDMLGNVWEWCADHWHDSHDGAPTDGTSWVEPQEVGDKMVVRGGAWSSKAASVRSACRYGNALTKGGHSLGFRCARGQP